MSRWTESEYREYVARRLKHEQPAREKMSPLPFGILHSKKLLKGSKNKMSAAKKVVGSGQRHNPTVVLAFFKQCGLPKPMFEHQFYPSRKWRMDIAFVDGENKVYIEVQGGLFSGGRHVQGAALLKEYEKINAASTMGWLPIFVMPSQLLTQPTADLVREALEI